MAGEIQRTGWQLADGSVLDFMEIADGTFVKRSGKTIVGVEQGAVVGDAEGGLTVDVEARAAINLLLARLRANGMLAT